MFELNFEPPITIYIYTRKVRVTDSITTCQSLHNLLVYQYIYTQNMNLKIKLVQPQQLVSHIIVNEWKISSTTASATPPFWRNPAASVAPIPALCKQHHEPPVYPRARTASPEYQAHFRIRGQHSIYRYIYTQRLACAAIHIYLYIHASLSAYIYILATGGRGEREREKRHLGQKTHSERRSRFRVVNIPLSRVRVECTNIYRGSD